MTASRWATLYGNTGERDTQIAFDRCFDWAVHTGVPFQFRETWGREFIEYGLLEVPALRYTDLSSAVPQLDRVGLAEILRFINQS